MKKGFMDYDSWYNSSHKYISDRIVYDGSKEIEQLEEYFKELQKEFKEQEEIRDNYYKLLNDV